MGWATILGIEVPWEMFGYDTALLAVMAKCFLGIGMLISAIALFDPQLIVLGPSSYVLLDLFGVAGYKVFALAYPAALGLLSATIGDFIFRRGDLP